MLLSELVEPLEEKRQIGSGNPDISSIAYDSRCVTAGALFVSTRGQQFDGHDFVDEALHSGACAVMADDPKRIEAFRLDVPLIAVPDTRRALPILANHFFGYPSRRLKLVGVTGTKGKTTTTYLIEGVLRQAGLSAGVIGTLGARIRGAPVPLERTTPEAVELQGLLASMVSEGVAAAAMEVSSHALAMHRTDGCEYDVGVFTNLTHDHLDFHGSIEDYLETKLMLFDSYPRASKKPFTAVINADDPRSERVCRATYGDILTFGIRNPADVQGTNVSVNAKGVSFLVLCPAGQFHVALSLGGIFNVYNSLAAIGAALSLGVEAEQIKSGLESIRAVDGRFESVDCGQDFAVIVDYAHSPDSLENVLKSARELTRGRLILVFGCGGDRDKMKRPVMGKIASDLADLCIVTSDNPRSEEPQAIINEIVAGMDERASVEAIVDRLEAIKRALDAAGAGDLVLVAGKGHETYQIFKDRTVHFDDREVVRELLCGSGSG
ncbi:MAG TPA: UDP-N-acetylmuramoyl-L-alanyl-D-glutamate--2,6-diaminopimelate ligase [Armatimonadota bacterium]|nr:UDP-N-acetylmuramoyl-L-alanyl-D-glutamate--2,6-diaminopimelate ligase [Armatimonadota bacterium]